MLPPREKLQQRGAETLTTEELLSLLLGSGTKERSVFSIARTLAQWLPGKVPNYAELTKISGIGPAKACTLLAAMELVERLRPRLEPHIGSVNDALSWVQHLRHQTREHLICLYLNARNTVLYQETIAIGQINVVHAIPRDVFFPIRHAPVCRILIAHNHPSDDTKPSMDDIHFTQRLEAAGRLLGIEILDHLIVGNTSHASFKELGLLGQHLEPPSGSSAETPRAQTGERSGESLAYSTSDLQPYVWPVSSRPPIVLQKSSRSPPR
jgi:DNA repair protein RadC